MLVVDLEIIQRVPSYLMMLFTISLCQMLDACSSFATFAAVLCVRLIFASDYLEVTVVVAASFLVLAVGAGVIASGILQASMVAGFFVVIVATSAAVHAHHTRTRHKSGLNQDAAT